jgi:bifunctional non-homologous end joining protein LigD
MVFDLDPGPGVAWERVIDGARLVRDRLERLGHRSFVKTTGGKGLHVVVPLPGREGWDAIRAFARDVGESIAREYPSDFMATMSKAKRRGRAFIDCLRNARGATAVAPYSTRARPGAPVATPLRWDELRPSLRSDAFTVENLRRRLARLRSDPWSGFAG